MPNGPPRCPTDCGLVEGHGRLRRSAALTGVVKRSEHTPDVATATVGLAGASQSEVLSRISVGR
jgi:hypothetical protein